MRWVLMLFTSTTDNTVLYGLLLTLAELSYERVACSVTSKLLVVSLAWLTNSNRFLSGCKNGLLASVG